MENIAFFDFDGTITNTDTFTKFVYYVVDSKVLGKGKLFLAPYIVGYKLGLVSGSTVRSKIFNFGFKNKSEEEISSKGLEYSINFLPKVLRDNAMERIKWHKEQGDVIVIVSASLDSYLKPWCDLHNLDLICSEVDCLNGKLTGTYKNKDCSGSIKKERILKKYNLSKYKEIYVYGDTKEDLEMLSLGTVKFYQWKEIK